MKSPKSNNVPGSKGNLQPPTRNFVHRSPGGSPLPRPSGPAPKPPGLAAVSPRPRGPAGPQFRPPSAQPVTSPGFPRPPVARMPLNPGGGPPAFRLPGMGSPPIQAMQPPPPPPSDPCPDNQPSIGNGSSRSVNRPPASLPAKPPINRPKPTVPQVRALYGYDASDIDELTFNEGDIMVLVQEDKSGWWTCRFRGQEGFCPANYLEKM